MKIELYRNINKKMTNADNKSETVKFKLKSITMKKTKILNIAKYE